MKKQKIIVVAIGNDGLEKLRQVEGRIFKHSINGREFEFCHHQKLSRSPDCYTITHVRSGRAVCTVYSRQMRSAIKDFVEFLQITQIDPLYESLISAEAAIAERKCRNQEKKLVVGDVTYDMIKDTD